MDYLQNVKEHLDQEKIDYKVMHHEPAYTAMEIAGAQHVPGKMLAKSVIVKAGDKYVMAVLPSTHRVDFDQFCTACGQSHAQLASEEEIADLFPECEIGAEPPLSLGHDIEIWADDTLEEDSEIVFNAGTHRDTIKMKYDDWKRVAHPKVAQFGVHV